MPIKRRVFISSPRDEYLDDRRNEVKRAIVNEIASLNYEPQAFGHAKWENGLVDRRGWSAQAAEEVMRRCVGAAVLGFPIWMGAQRVGGNPVSLVTEYCHYEGAIARACQLPILAVLEEGVEERVFFGRHAGDRPIRLPKEAGPAWVAEEEFRDFLEAWHARLQKRKDVFLAYSGELAGTAGIIKTILTDLGATVLDWKSFVGGATILEQVEDAAAHTTGGVFLFTRDEEPKKEGAPALPRDNVIFEAGFFAHAKGHERVLIIREQGAKMPADLGGVVYERLADRSDAGELEVRLQRFLEVAI